MGFGNAGKAYAKLLIEKEKQITEELGYRCIVTGIATGTKGNLVDNNGIDLSKVLSELKQNNCFDKKWSEYCNLTNEEMINSLDYDVLVEMTPLNIFTGQPAIDHVKGAFARSKHVVTANKGPIAWEYKQLREMASNNNSLFFYETTVMDGTPVFNMAKDTLPMCKVTEVSGILNSTTNFVLLEMAAGKTYEQAIEEGKNRGFVEANPAMDLEGYDAAAKITALINVLMDADIKPTDIERNGIDKVTSELIHSAADRNKVLKLVCRGFYEAGKVKGEVKLIEVDTDDILASVKGTTSIISITTDLMGKITVIEHEPEIEQTGYGIFSDTIRIMKQLK
jgi:homoserine dehydrogenase